ncbi:MAG TPA: hypothetical protein VK395_31265 [Gemmataceae bacterium]|nr:hypothetical protein [Gemmataceae bacterium]
MNPATPAAVQSRDSALRSALQSWNHFWFRPADPTVLGFIRIWCGLITLYVHVAYTVDLQEFFGKDAWFSLPLATEFRRDVPWVAPSPDWYDDPSALSMPTDPAERAQILEYAQKWGTDPRTALARGNVYSSVWFHVTDPAWMNIVHGGVLAIMLLFTLGFCTRVTSVLTWLAALSYIQRSPITLFGMDTMMNIALLYLMIGPSGAALSLDRLIARYRWKRCHPGLPALPVEPSVSANFAIRLMQVHFCFIYMGAGLSKLLGGVWWNGTALWGTVANYEFTPIRFAYYAEPLRWLCQHRWLWEIVMTTGVVYTLALEISFPFLVWQRKFRGLMVAGSVLLHTVIAFSMGLIGFGLFMMVLVMSFIPAEALHELLNGFGRRISGPRATPTALARGGSQAA